MNAKFRPQLRLLTISVSLKTESTKLTSSSGFVEKEDLY